MVGVGDDLLKVGPEDVAKRRSAGASAGALGKLPVKASRVGTPASVGKIKVPIASRLDSAAAWLSKKVGRRSALSYALEFNPTASVVTRCTTKSMGEQEWQALKRGLARPQGQGARAQYLPIIRRLGEQGALSVLEENPPRVLQRATEDVAAIVESYFAAGLAAKFQAPRQPEMRANGYVSESPDEVARLLCNAIETLKTTLEGAGAQFTPANAGGQLTLLAPHIRAALATNSGVSPNVKERLAQSLVRIIHGEPYGIFPTLARSAKEGNIEGFCDAYRLYIQLEPEPNWLIVTNELTPLLAKVKDVPQMGLLQGVVAKVEVGLDAGYRQGDREAGVAWNTLTNAVDVARQHTDKTFLLDGEGIHRIAHASNHEELYKIYQDELSKRCGVVPDHNFMHWAEGLYRAFTVRLAQLTPPPKGSPTTPTTAIAAFQQACKASGVELEDFDPSHPADIADYASHVVGGPGDLKVLIACEHRLNHQRQYNITPPSPHEQGRKEGEPIIRRQWARMIDAEVAAILQKYPSRSLPLHVEKIISELEALKPQTKVVASALYRTDALRQLIERTKHDFPEGHPLDHLAANPLTPFEQLVVYANRHNVHIVYGAPGEKPKVIPGPPSATRAIRIPLDAAMLQPDNSDAGVQYLVQRTADAYKERKQGSLQAMTEQAERVCATISQARMIIESYGQPFTLDNARHLLSPLAPAIHDILAPTTPMEEALRDPNASEDLRINLGVLQRHQQKLREMIAPIRKGLLAELNLKIDSPSDFLRIYRSYHLLEPTPTVGQSVVAESLCSLLNNFRTTTTPQIKKEVEHLMRWGAIRLEEAVRRGLVPPQALENLRVAATKARMALDPSWEQKALSRIQRAHRGDELQRLYLHYQPMTPRLEAMWGQQLLATTKPIPCSDDTGLPTQFLKACLSRGLVSKGAHPTPGLDEYRRYVLDDTKAPDPTALVAYERKCNADLRIEIAHQWGGILQSLENGMLTLTGRHNLWLIPAGGALARAQAIHAMGLTQGSDEVANRLTPIEQLMVLARRERVHVLLAKPDGSPIFISGGPSARSAISFQLPLTQ